MARPAPRRPTHIAITSEDGAFAVLVNRERVRVELEELEAHHWAKHVMECVSQGVTRPAEIRHELPRLCAYATQNHLHTGYAGHGQETAPRAE